MKRREQSKISADVAGRAQGNSGGSVTILHVDDDPNDTALLQAASLKARVDFKLQNVEDGDQTLEYLIGKGPYSDRSRFPFPAVILLDLKLPRSTGFDILKWIRSDSDPAISKLPVVVLSGSELKEDIQSAYAAGANSYLVKPLGFTALVDLARNIGKVWLTVNSPLPPGTFQGDALPNSQVRHQL